MRTCIVSVLESYALTIHGLLQWTPLMLECVLLVTATDFRFSVSRGGKRIPYASAGDCYSSQSCPQGQFKVNLEGTGLKLAADAVWTVAGFHSSKHINVAEVSLDRVKFGKTFQNTPHQT